jgi:Tol biopolymer transport system component
MGLPTGTKLGPYEVIAPLGAGGMGEVYRARDTRLNREVAIKVLPAVFASDADRLKRFEQEASATSALNHPNILTIYDIGRHEGAPYIVAELLEGEELVEILVSGALPARKAIDYARQIVSGLDAAHEKGIVHRDLKPANLFITNDGRVKILDFGLAKLKPSTLAAVADSEGPTMMPATNPGVVLGTVGYMSPEQVRGQTADHRSDIFSFGVVLFEMLTGRKAFSGDSAVELMNAILKDDVPELNDNDARISPALEKIMRRCLEKKPEHRFHSAHDLGFALEAVSTATSSSGSGLPAATKLKSQRFAWSDRSAWIVTGILALTLLAMGFMYFNRPALEARSIRLAFVPPQNLAFNDGQPDNVIISPDGQKMAFSAVSPDGKWQLWVRRMDSPDAQLLSGTDDPLEPFWSPDSRSIAFGSQGKLKRVDLTGGSPQILCDAARMTGGSWSNKGIIVFGSDYGSALFQVPETGGEPKPATVMDREQANFGHSAPYFLPDGKHFLFRINITNPRGVWVGSLDSPEIKQVLNDNTNAAYASGFLLFLRNEVLMAQPFDLGSLQLKGEAAPVVTGGTSDSRGARRFSISENGVLVWQGNWQREYQLVWFDRGGKQVGVVGAPMKVSTGQEPHLSPDGKRLVIKRDNNIWVIDLARETGIRLTSVFSQLPLWSPDGSHVAFQSSIEGTTHRGIAQKAANGVGETELLWDGVKFPQSWSPDGRFILFMQRGVKTRLDIWALELSGEKKEHVILNSAFDEREPQISPDGRWLAYCSDESGNYEIYVQPFTAEGKVGGDKKRVSTTGGTEPLWRRDGKELFFVADGGKMMSVAVANNGGQLEFAAPKFLFQTHMHNRYSILHEYDVSPDGQRFLIGTLIGESKAPPPTVILNWTADLKK